jgi:hypothetical protein
MVEFKQAIKLSHVIFRSPCVICHYHYLKHDDCKMVDYAK